MLRTANPSLLTRVARMIEAFEGGWLAGDFDGMVLSWGPFQWNLGQGTLQPLLRRIVTLNPVTVQQHLGSDIIPAIRNDMMIPFARAQMLLPTGAVRPDWAKRFARLAQEPIAQQAFAEAMKPYIDRGQRLCEAVGFETERGLALCCDVAVQNGAPRKDHVNLYQQRLASGIYAPETPLVNPSEPEEWERLKLLAWVVADSANPRWRNDVYARKTTIALGRGTVHKRAYVMHEDFGIRYWEDPGTRTLARWWTA